MTVRLFVAGSLAQGATVALAAGQAHYLRNVMRRAPGDAVLVFNGRDGEWRATIRDLGKKGGVLEAGERTRPQQAEADLWLLAAPVKRTAIDFVAAKATELGVALIQPVITQRTVVERVNLGRLQANCLEAAEQCHRLTVPEALAAEPLARVLKRWPRERRLVLCDETGAGGPVAAALERERAHMPEPWAILIGPEGGFAPAELAELRRLPSLVPVALGSRLLRADTAALAALAVWQAVLGEWRAS